MCGLMDRNDVIVRMEVCGLWKDAFVKIIMKYIRIEIEKIVWIEELWLARWLLE